ncbi:MAG TPA: nodulation protein NfeD, partial [Candidatus Krumholzibacteria bacterium]|nr:nodulation protein NfeD [Candidatus Krumholzibacteria bacterium]
MRADPVPAATTVVEARVDGAIGPATTAYIERVLATAAATGATCVVISIDTPGGLSEAMRDIVQAILASPVPVVTYVQPGGAR